MFHKNTLKASLQPYRIVALLLLLAIAGSLRTFFALDQVPFANGWDAYYYLVQVKAVFQEGRMHSPDYSLIYALLLFFKLFTADYVLAYKLAMALTGGLFIIALYVFTIRWVPENKVSAGILAASFGLFSPAALFVSSQFPKNYLGIVFLIFFLSSLPRGKWYVVLLLFLATFLTHRLTGVVALVFLVFRYANRRYWKWLTVFIGLAIAASILVPGVLHISDIGRLFGEFSPEPQWAHLSFIRFYGMDKLHASWMVDLGVSVIAVAVFLVMTIQKFRSGKGSMLLAFLIVALLLLFPFYTFTSYGPALRLLLSFLMLTPVFFMIWAARLKKIWVVLASSILVCGSLWSVQAYQASDFDPPYALYDEVSRRAMQHEECRNAELVVAHKALAEYFTFTSGKDALPWQPEPEVPMHKIIRITCGIELWEFETYLDSATSAETYPLIMNYCLIPEQSWQKFMKSAGPADSSIQRRIRSWENPWQIRPAFIQKSKRL